MLEQEQYMSPILMWDMSPLMSVVGTEVLQNARRSTAEEYGKESEKVDLEADYKEMRNLLLKDNFVVIGATGRNKSGKGSMLMGFSRAFRQDLYLKQQMKKRGIELEITSVPFVHVREAARLEEAPEEFRIPADARTPKDYTVDVVRKGSRFQWDLIEKHVFPPGVKTKEEVTESLKRDRKAVVLFVEASTPLVYPTTKTVPVEVEGVQDLGNSTLYNLAFDPRTRENLFLYFIKKDEELKNDEASTKFRHRLSLKRHNFRSIFEGDIRVVFVRSDGEEVDASQLSADEKRKIASILAKSMASPALVKQLDRTLDDFEKRVVTEKGIQGTDNEDLYFGFISGILWLPKRFVLISNPQFTGEKTYDLDYLNSLPARLHPKILE